MKKLLIILLFSHWCTSGFSQLAWTQKASMPSAGRESAGSFTIGSSVYVVCGRTSISPYQHVAQLWEYNTITDTWIQRANYPGGPRTAPVAFSAGGKGYVVSGGYPTMYTDCWMYDPATDTWLQKNNFPGGGRYTAAHFVLGTNMYMVGGYFNGTQSSEVWRYNTVTDTWQKMNNFGGGPTQASIGFAINGDGYIVTSFANSATTNNAWRYNVINDSWTAVAPLPGMLRITCVAFVLNGTAYVGLGSNGALTAHYNDFYSYNPTLNAWSQATTLPSFGRRHAIAHTIGSMAYVGTGVSAPPPGNSSDFRNDLYSFGSCQAPFAPDVSAFNLNICAGQAFSLSATGQGNITWHTTPAGTAAFATGSVLTWSGLSAGTYTFYAQATTCAKSPRTPVLISVYPPPLVSIQSSSQPLCLGETATLSVTGANAYIWNTGSAGLSIVVSPSISTTYNVTGTDQNQCQSSDTLVLQVAPLPQITINSSGQTLCAGQSATLSASGALFYSWNTGAAANVIVVSPSVSAVYSVTGTDVNNCSNLGVYSLSVAPLPQLLISSTREVICKDQSVSLMASGALSYSWSNGATGSTVLVKPGVTTVYTVTGTDQNNCSNSQTFTQHVSACTGLSSLQKAGIEVYPNPAHGEINIMVPEQDSEITAEIRDCAGRIILDEKLAPGIRNFKGITPGLYIYTIRQDNFTVKQGKLVVQ